MVNKKWLTTRWFRFIAMPALAALPSGTAAFWFGWHHDLKSEYLLKQYEPVVFAATALWAFCISALKSYLNDFAKTTIESLERAQEDLAHLFNYVRIVVGAKSRRFCEALQSLPDQPDPGKTFFEITRPDKQLEELVRAIHGYFQIEANPSAEKIKVSLMNWNGAHLAFRDWYPDADSPRAEATRFNDTQTLAGLAFHTKQLVISEDLEKDDRYQHFGGRDTGSLFSYPVVDDQIGEVVFVVNVMSTKIGRFKTQDIKRIRTAMDIFAERMILENRLERIKQQVLAKQSGGGSVR